MNVGHGLRSLWSATLVACLGTGCSEQKTPEAARIEDSRGETSAPLLGTPSQVKDLNPGSQPDNFLHPAGFFIELGNTVLFAATDKVHGRELWRTDGTAAGTSLVLDLFPGPTGSDPSNAVVMNGRVYFLAGATGNGVYQDGLWSTDGTTQGTRLVKPLHADGTFLTQRNGALFLGTTDPARTSAGFALWRSDGTPDGTVLLHSEQVETGVVGGHSAAWVGDTLVFTSAGATQGLSLWKTDGTTEGTVLLSDPVPGFDFNFVGGLIECGGKALYTAQLGENVHAL
ncbi:ELWxxDGT repeat protein [Pyxidicoccus xibeiensis]|uniref:ELWxxDGT repeat protein n=1 Tax=Pyxidicoccus xibeiensis TaxID=2906759 RepID=UPI0020A7717D|nr:ELWxxDGT repeat protein [Pyxidicoccus xibeiensis]MCP3145240.1 hypothetical protein [Pyxidicoccus xibeiensis]